MGGVTQLASSSEGDVFHNRLTHSLKVAQIGLRLAQRLAAERPSEVSVWGLDPDMVEAACLAHDLGHPPFGHDGEEVLADLLAKCDPDGFEGNAQSFRIVTRLAGHTENTPEAADGAGLNLTRATLNAILKYPWLRAESGPQHDKWGAYRADEDQFRWARSGVDVGVRSLEAELMDWADDVTYAVHDLEDFYRAGLIPIHVLSQPAERDRFLKAAVDRYPDLAAGNMDLEATLAVALGQFLLLDAPYDGGRTHREIINAATSSLITQFVTGDSIRICEPSATESMEVDPDIRLQVDLLKDLTWYYVIDHPSIVSIRKGERTVLRELFRIYVDIVANRASNRRYRTLVPRQTRDRLESGDEPPRLVADLLAGMTERQVIQTYQRLTGTLQSPTVYFDV